MNQRKTVAIYDFEGQITDDILIEKIPSFVDDFRRDFNQVLFSERNGLITPSIERKEFINNQLTLIDKGHKTGNWDDLDIYQTTLGKYWDVPWYEGVTNGSEDFVENARKEKPNDKFYSFYKPTIDYFLKNYDSKFKDLPTIKE